MRDYLARHEIVLLGIGHTNAHVLRMWKMQPIPDARLTCVSNFPVATYSGMLPGVLGKRYEPHEMEIDLVRLCRAANARLIVDDVTGIDRESRTLLFADRSPLPFDLLSIGIGSVPTTRGVEIAGAGPLFIKPMQTLLDRLTERVSRVDRDDLRIAIVGGGAGGVEVAFNLPHFLQRDCQLTLIESTASLLGGMKPKTAARAEQLLQERGVQVMRSTRVARVEDAGVTLVDGSVLEADIVIWATGADSPALLQDLGLPTDDRGFLLVKPTLQSTSDEFIFSVGDTATIEGEPLPKAGVFAVRQGPVLWQNIRSLIAGRQLKPYRPQRGFLKLLNTGDGKALGEWKWFTPRGKLAWKWKDSIDRRFMRKYQNYEPMPMAAKSEAAEMRCTGCGGKVGGDVLSRVLKRLQIERHPRVAIGLDQPDDAAVIKTGEKTIVTTDFFASFWDDAFTVARIAALNALSDLFAMNAKPIAAVANVTIPEGPARRQEELLEELLAGALREFDSHDVALVGGHTIEGPRVEIGFTIFGDESETTWTKSGLRPGDRIWLSKPLGTGVMLAAWMDAELPWQHRQPLLDSMLQSNGMVCDRLARTEVTAATDVTGFGLAGHLLEMLTASGLSAEIRLDAVPLLPGAEELIAAGVESTLAPANRSSAEVSIDASESVRSKAAYSALFDPQTSGGMLFGTTMELESATLVEIARVLNSDGGPRLSVV